MYTTVVVNPPSADILPSGVAAACQASL